jgi:hypothetical protein
MRSQATGAAYWPGKQPPPRGSIRHPASVVGVLPRQRPQGSIPHPASVVIVLVMQWPSGSILHPSFVKKLTKSCPRLSKNPAGR